jgi:hypothetical protein
MEVLPSHKQMLLLFDSQHVSALMGRLFYFLCLKIVKCVRLFLILKSTEYKVLSRIGPNFQLTNFILALEFICTPSSFYIALESSDDDLSGPKLVESIII